MADSIPTRPNKPFPQILCKSLLFILFLAAIPLFPSQAPDFVKQTILTKVWELIHLLFIGVVVSYGLFCRRNVDVDFDQQQQPSSVDESQSSLVYRIFDTPSIFEDGCQNLSGFDEKAVYFNNQAVVNGSDRNLESEIRFVSKEHYEFGGKSLGLPVRSLNSRVGESVEFDYQFSNGNELDSSVKDSYGGSLNQEVFGDVGNGNLGDGAFDGAGNGHSEDGLDGGLNLPSGIPWRSKSVRVRLGENEGFANRPAHFRPLSIDETQFEAFSLHSFRPTTSLSSRASSLSNSPTIGSPVSSVSSEMPIMEGEESGDLKGYRASYPPDSQSSKKAANAPLNAFHLRRYSSGSLFRKEPCRSLKDELRDLRESRLREKVETLKLLKSDEKPVIPPPKSSSRGKSVRTIRGSQYTKETKKLGESRETRTKHIDDEVGRKHDEGKFLTIGKTDVKKKVFDSVSHGVSKNLIGKSDAKKEVFESVSHGASKNLNSEYFTQQETFTGNIRKTKDIDDERNFLSIGKTDTRKEVFDGVSHGVSKNLDARYLTQQETFARHQKIETEPKENAYLNFEEASETESESSQATQVNTKYVKQQQQTLTRRKKKETEPNENVFVESEEAPKSEAESSRSTQVRKDKNIAAETADAASDAGSDLYEVDKKAAEFIARFREQIRLQKVVPVEQKRGMSLSANNFR